MLRAIKYLLLLILLASAFTLAQTPTQINIPLQNPSFEQGASGWYWGAGCRPFQLAGAVAPNPQWPLPQPPDGSMVALGGYGCSFFQDTGVEASQLQAVSHGGNYGMTFSVANYLNAYPGYYEAKIYLGQVDPVTQVLSGQEICDTGALGRIDFTQVTLTCPVSGYLVFDRWPDNVPEEPVVVPFDLHAHLIVFFHLSGWPQMIDKISLDFTAAR